MKVRELRGILSEFDQDAEVKVEVVFSPDEVVMDYPVILDVIDIDINRDDEVVLEAG